MIIEEDENLHSNIDLIVEKKLSKKYISNKNQPIIENDDEQEELFENLQ